MVKRGDCAGMEIGVDGFVAEEGTHVQVVLKAGFVVTSVRHMFIHI